MSAALVLDIPALLSCPLWASGFGFSSQIGMLCGGSSFLPGMVERVPQTIWVGILRVVKLIRVGGNMFLFLGSLFEEEDNYAWSHDPKGLFSVKFGYPFLLRRGKK